MAPSVFAAVLGLSETQIQDLEAGRSKASAESLQKLTQLATKYNRADLALILGGPWSVLHVIQPGETLISSARVDCGNTRSDTKPIRSDEGALWHDLLDEILSSGDEDAVIAVQHNLVVFGKTVRLGRKYEKKKSG